MILDMPLMKNNILKEDLDRVIDFLKEDPILTQSKNVKMFEEEWSRWLGVKHSVFVNSGSSANMITISALKYLFGTGEIIVPTLTWVSDITSIILNGFKPVFVDINPVNLAMNEEEVISKLNENTRAVFITHVLGFNGLSDKLLTVLREKNILLIEDVCESHGATFKGKKLGSYGKVSNFSFYYAHHMSTIEGGMICTDDDDFYEVARMLRSHGMVREASSEAVKLKYKEENPELNPEFIFAYPGFNMRGTEINAVIGRNQLKRLDENNKKRYENFKLFLDNLDTEKYRTDFDLEGSVNYAFVLILKNKDMDFCNKVMEALKEAKVEFRRGTSGGGNQLRQPYLKDFVEEREYEKYKEVEHVHFYGFYIGNYPDIEKEKVLELCKLLNNV